MTIESADATASRRVRAALAEVLLIAFAYLAYAMVRQVVRDDFGMAFSNAARVMRWESVHHLAWEMQVQLASLRSMPLTHLLNAIYALVYWPTLVLSLIYLYVRRRDLYRCLRSALLLSGLVGLMLFAAFPLAPPRFADVRITDTIAVHDPPLHEIARPGSLTNQYAAMPSFHFGWTLICGVCVSASQRRRIRRLGAVALPLVMGVAVIATGNHYIVDVIVGGALTISALCLSFVLERRRGTPAGPHARIACRGTSRRWSPERSCASTRPRALQGPYSPKGTVAGND